MLTTCAGLWLALLAGGPTELAVGANSLRCDPATGAFRRLAVGGEVLQPPPDLAECWRLTLQPAEGPAVTVVGRRQRLGASRLDAGVLHLDWPGPLTDETGGRQAVDVRMTVTPVADGFSFGLELDNRTTAEVVEVVYPLVGGLVGWSPDATLWAPTTTPTQRPLQPTAGGVAFGYPGHLNLGFLAMPSAARQHVWYLAPQETLARNKQLRLQELGSELAMAVAHPPHLPPGGTFVGAPVVIRCVPGEELAAARLYRDWFASAFGIVQPEDDWIRRQSFFLMTMFMLPEGTINYTFADIPRWARAAREHGLGAVQISGWQLGGHDNGYPYYEPDPRLGTWEDLEAGVRYCHDLGLKVFFFVNYQPMMVELDWYKQELEQYREMGPNGAFTWLAGWGMGTLWARAGHPELMTWANLAFPEFRRIIVGYFTRLAEIGADGVHVDKMFPTAVDFNPRSPLPADTATWHGAILLSEEIRDACRRINPDWCMSFECNWDRMLQFGGATWWVGNQLVTRRIFPEHVETLAITQAYDYLGINHAVRDGHAIMLAPLGFTRGLDWAPIAGLADYIHDVKAVRDRLQETVFWGEVLGAGALTIDAPPDGVAWNVFRHRRTGRRAIILTNSRSEDRAVRLEPAFVTARLHYPGRETRDVALPATVDLPAERLVFVEELEAGR